MKNVANTLNAPSAVTAGTIVTMGLLLYGPTPVSKTIEEGEPSWQNSAAEESADVTPSLDEPVVESDDTRSDDPAAAMAYIRIAPRPSGAVAIIHIGGLPNPAISKPIVEIAPKQGPPLFLSRSLIEKNHQQEDGSQVTAVPKRG